MSTLTVSRNTSEASKRAIEWCDTLEASRRKLEASTEARSAIARPDLGFCIFYASTASHSLEARATGRGQFAYRINLETFKCAEDIPTTYRKLRAIALKIEANDTGTLALLNAQYMHTLALVASNEYRAEAERAEAEALLAEPSPFA